MGWVVEGEDFQEAVLVGEDQGGVVGGLGFGLGGLEVGGLWVCLIGISELHARYFTFNRWYLLILILTPRLPKIIHSQIRQQPPLPCNHRINKKISTLKTSN